MLFKLRNDTETSCDQEQIISREMMRDGKIRIITNNKVIIVEYPIVSVEQVKIYDRYKFKNN